MTSNSVPPPPDASEGGVPKEGDVLAGKYRVERVLGEGGMGVVVAAQHTTLRQRVAIKLLLPEAAKRADSAERFLREARASVSIQSEHVTRVMDVGQLETGAPYMVMELLTGKDLDVHLENRGKFGMEEGIDYVLQACEAIAEAHSLGIVHRDLKPANLFLTQRADGSPLVKVLDFGLSKLTRPDALDENGLTAVGVVMGSPCYMSPEQVRSLKDLDARTDIWALGVILYQVLTGALPFDAPSIGALFFMIGADPPAPMRERFPYIPAELEAGIFRCLEKDKAKRIQTVAELARVVAPFAGERSRVSIERIHRVLNDPSPIPQGPRAGRTPSLPDGVADLALGGPDSDNAPTLMRDPAVFASNPRSVPPPPPPGAVTVPATASKPPPPTASKPPPATTSKPPPATTSSQPRVLGAAPPPVLGAAPSKPAQIKSGSVPGIVSEREAPSLPPPRPARGRGGMVGAIVGIAVLAGVGATFVAVRGMSPSSEPVHPGTTAAAADVHATPTDPAHPATPAATDKDAGAPQAPKP